MSIEEMIKKAVRENKIVFGFRRTLKYIRNNKAEAVIIAKNAPEHIKKVIMNSNVNVLIFEGSSKDLGTICGRPHPITTLAVKGEQ
jgi:large subunit ribosomal protein L30e